MKAVKFDSEGHPMLVEVPDPCPGATDVVIEPAFAGINPTDTYHAERVSSGVDRERIPGVEVSGVVVGVGREVSRWAVGDEVIGLVHDGGQASRVIADENLLMPRPSELDPLHASAVPEVFITAHDALHQARTGPGDRVLVTGASGAVGQAAVQLALADGADVVGAVRSREAAAVVEDFGARAVLHDASLEPGEGDLPTDAFDVVIELVGGLNLRHDLAAVRSCGRIVVVAAQGDDVVSFPLRGFKTKRTTLIGSTLRRRGRAAKTLAVRHFEQFGLPLVREGRVRPVVAAVFEFAAVAQAYQTMGRPGRYGKVMLALSDS